MSNKATDTYPYRAPKKYPNKDLHGRMRILSMAYKDFERFQKFYVNVFGWDMFELPESAGGAPKGSKTPSLLIATGPSYETYEGVVPGHVNVSAHYAPGELDAPVFCAELHMDRPIKETLEDMIAHGAVLLSDMPKESEGWSTGAAIKDPSGNLINVWKCPSSRTWEEPETGYDKEEQA